MHVLPMHGLRRLFALTGGGTRKIDHITRRPEVSWIITCDQEETVLLKGVATVNPEATPALWDRFGPVLQRYSVGPMSDDAHLELVTIETRIETGEVISPSLGVCVPQAIDVDA